MLARRSGEVEKSMVGETGESSSALGALGARMLVSLLKWVACATIAIGAFIFAGDAPVHAQATRTWVSGVGDDVNPCSRTAPCKTFAGAISKTAAFGEISVLDPGGFGAVTITKSITIDGGTGEGWASILATATNGIIINAANTDVVQLRNISINGNQSGGVGIRILSAKAVYIQNLTIFDFRAAGGSDPGRGIRDSRANGGQLFVSDTTIQNNAEGAVVIVAPAGAPRINASFDNVRFEGNRDGVSVVSGGLVMLSNCIISGNSGVGVVAQTPPGSVAATEVNVENCVVAQNTTGISSQLGVSLIRISNTAITGNSTGISIPAGTVQTFGNNKIAANGAGNAPSPGAGIPQQ